MAAAEVDVHASALRRFSTTRTCATTATSALQNDQIAKLVKAHPDRFVGIATLPMQARPSGPPRN